MFRPPKVQASRIQMASLPAPVGGLNTVAGANIPPEDCLALWNMVPGEYGLRTRLGTREHATGLDGPVRSLLSFTGSAKSRANDRLFACTESGIWDVTTPGEATFANRVLEFDAKTDDSGWGVATVFTTIADGHILCYTDEANGYYYYRESNDSWHKVTAEELTGVDPTRLVSVTAHKGALWFVERDTANAWYLEPGVLFGAAEAFAFGSRFHAGGDLRGLWNWTHDGAAGMDDSLVAVSGGGDVLAYGGVSPAVPASWGIIGHWFVGAVPPGRRLCSDMGGDLVIMTALGLLPLSRLSSGALVQSTTFETFKVSNLFNQLQAGTGAQRGWAVRVHPADNTLFVLIPPNPSYNETASQALVMSLPRKSWSRYRGLPVTHCAESFGGALYLGTQDGRVVVNDGYVDGLKLDGTGATPISFSLITSFQDLGRPTTKRIQLLRPTFLAQGPAPAYRIEARYRWNLAEASVGGWPVLPSPNPNIWAAAQNAEGAVWDESSWDGFNEWSSHQNVNGATGIGPQMAIAVAGQASSPTSLASVDVIFDEGGVL